jgi:hypothetical protein
MKLGKAYEQGRRFKNSSFFRFKAVLQYFMHRFHFYFENWTIFINPNSCDCLSKYPAYYHWGSAQLELTLTITLIGIEFYIFFKLFFF